MPRALAGRRRQMYGAAAPWTPAVLGPWAWFREDYGLAPHPPPDGPLKLTWFDKTVNARDAYVVAGSDPSDTTIGGQHAFNFTGGTYFQNNADNLPAGSARSILVVGQGLDAFGGCILAMRTSTTYQGSILFNYSGTQYLGGDGANVGQNVVQGGSAFDFTTNPFLAEWLWPGSGSSPTVRLNRSVQTIASGTQGTETGGAGFIIANSSAPQQWSGKLAELVIVARVLTGDEIVAWEDYVNARYGI